MDTIVDVPKGHTINKVMQPIVDKMGFRLVRGDGPQISIKSRIILPTEAQVVRIFTLEVLAPKDEPLVGASIGLSGSNRFSRKVWTTNSAGIAHIESTERSPAVWISYTGMQTQEKVLSDKGTTSVEMQPSSDALDVEVKGYTRQSRRLNTGDADVISGQDLHPVSDAGLLNTLEGKVPGVAVTQSSGNTLGSSHLLIHGISSIVNGPDALYIVDNVPFAPGNQSLTNIPSGNAAGSLDAFRAVGINNIDRIEILKDADATAIYGSRGANGVVLITTTQTGRDTPMYSIEASTGITMLSQNFRMMNTRQYLAMRHDAFRLDQTPVTTSNAPDLSGPDTSNYTNWRKWLIGNTAHSYSVKSSITGGRENANYFIGLNGLSENSVYITQPLHTNLNLTFNGNLRPGNGKFTLHTYGMFGRDDDNQFLTDPTKESYLAPMAPDPDHLLDPNGRPVSNANNIPFLNPWYFLRQTYHAISQNFLLDGVASYQLWPSLSLQTNVGKNIVSAREYDQTPIIAYPAGPAPGSSEFSYTKYGSFILEPQLQFKKWIGSWHLDLLGGYSYQRQTGGMHTLSATGFTSDADLRHPELAPQLDPDSASSAYSYHALFGRFNIRLQERYILNMTIRRDGSSRLSPQSQYGTFYAAGGAWLFSSEPFVNEVLPILSYGKLRGSWGLTGNDQVGGHYLTSWSPNAAAAFQNIPGWPTKGSITSGQTWETIKKMELGIELGFVHDRLMLSAIWYRNRSSNQLLPDLTTPQNWRNYPGTVLENRGWDLTLTAQIIRKKDFSWNLSFNWSLPVNRLLAFPDLDKTGYAQRLIVGQSINALKTYKYLGVDAATGLYRFLDRNHDNKYDDSDLVITPAPDITAFGGISTTIRYKSFVLESLFDARKKTGSNYLGPLYSGNPPGTLGTLYSNAPASLTRSWKQPGDKTSVQKVSQDPDSPANMDLPFFTASDGMRVNTSFIRWRSLYLAYRLPWRLSKASAKINVTPLLFLRAQNLLTITPYKGSVETESTIVLPTLRTFEIGIHL
jgi:TonB-linked SusC/RagA family outer membrane protein